MLRFKDLSQKNQEGILPGLREFYDRVTFIDRSNWIMKIFYGHKVIFESFETYEFNVLNEEKEFELKKLRLFLDGVGLYKVTGKEVILVCDLDNEDYYLYR